MRTELIRVLPQGLHDEDDPVLPGKCFYCGTENEVLLCNWCRSVFYCRKHHGFHRHRSKCWPFVINQGRQLLATRDIKAGETILFERPSIVAPAPDSNPVCVACLKRLKNAENSKCSKCQLPICCDTCEQSEIHKPGKTIH